jgi:hypothetical protein
VNREENEAENCYDKTTRHVQDEHYDVLCLSSGQSTRRKLGPWSFLSLITAFIHCPGLAYIQSQDLFICVK